MVTQAGDNLRAHLVSDGQDVPLSSERELKEGQKLSVLIEDDAQLRAFAAADEDTVIPRMILVAAAGATLFSWGAFRLRGLGPKAWNARDFNPPPAARPTTPP